MQTRAYLIVNTNQNKFALDSLKRRNSECCKKYILYLHRIRSESAQSIKWCVLCMLYISNHRPAEHWQWWWQPVCSLSCYYRQVCDIVNHIIVHEPIILDWFTLLKALCVIFNVYMLFSTFYCYCCWLTGGAWSYVIHDGPLMRAHQGQGREADQSIAEDSDVTFDEAFRWPQALDEYNPQMTSSFQRDARSAHSSVSMCLFCVKHAFLCNPRVACIKKAPTNGRR